MICFRLRRFDFHLIVSLYASDYDSDSDSVASENQPLDVHRRWRDDQRLSSSLTCTIEDAVTMRNGSLIGQFIHNQSHSGYKSCAFASPGHNCSQPLEHCNKKQLTKETHSVSESGLAKLNKQFLLELYGHSKRRSKSPPKLWMFKHITSLQKRSNIRTSLQVTLLVLRRVLLKEKLCVY